jgi:hypothetical protein
MNRLVIAGAVNLNALNQQSASIPIPICFQRTIDLIANMIVQDFMRRIKRFSKLSDSSLSSPPVCGTITLMKRWLLFLLSIAAGVAIGLLIGRVLLPVQYENTPLTSLAPEYNTDYVLLVAEAFVLEKDPQAASARLAQLSSQPVLEVVRQAILFAEQVGYTNQDLERLRSLQTSLENAITATQEAAP